MKKALTLLTASLIFATCSRADLPYEVHEWGTMTQVVGSDGAPLQWYQPSADIAGLPPFVLTNIFQSKRIPNALLRMETPVLYFYPKAPMSVTAEVALSNGRLTEWYPQPASDPMGRLLALQAGDAVPTNPFTRWDVELLPPDDKAGLAQIPAVPAGKGDHYGHAREVSEAWIVRYQTPAIGAQADKFIFYRGVADLTVPLQVTAPTETTLKIRNVHSEKLPPAFVLRVKDGRASWSRTAPLPYTKEPDKAILHQLPQEDQPVEEAAATLRTAMETSLAEAGLTPAEAKAMVATWQEAWFHEPGTRVLSLLPKKWIEQSVPLKLSPTPSELKRVFVARIEVFTIQQEQMLVELLNATAKGGDASVLADRASALKKLGFGRFNSAALERAVQLKSMEVRRSFFALESVK